MVEAVLDQEQTAVVSIIRKGSPVLITVTESDISQLLEKDKFTARCGSRRFVDQKYTWRKKEETCETKPHKYYGIIKSRDGEKKYVIQCGGCGSVTYYSQEFLMQTLAQHNSKKKAEDPLSCAAD